MTDTFLENLRSKKGGAKDSSRHGPVARVRFDAQRVDATLDASPSVLAPIAAGENTHALGRRGVKGLGRPGNRRGREKTYVPQEFLMSQ
jgi:hypothetical protein